MGTNDTQMGIEGAAKPAAQLRFETAERRSQHLSSQVKVTLLKAGVQKQGLPKLEVETPQHRRAGPVGRPLGDGSYALSGGYGA